MGNNKVNKYISMGIILNAVVIMCDRVLKLGLSQFILGLGYGIAISLMIIGYLDEKGMLSRIKRWKQKIFSI